MNVSMMRRSIASRGSVVRRPAPKVALVSRTRVTVVRCSAAVAAEAPAEAPPVTLTDAALAHLKKLKAESAATSSSPLLLRVGVRQGGCSGMSYNMDFESKQNVLEDDFVVAYDGGNMELVIDPKSLLYLFGMRLDFSDALIGGGFQFQNPNATDNCGCGKSFSV